MNNILNISCGKAFTPAGRGSYTKTTTTHNQAATRSRKTIKTRPRPQ